MTTTTTKPHAADLTALTRPAPLRTRVRVGPLDHAACRAELHRREAGR